jgi:hypothetical protein
MKTKCITSTKAANRTLENKNDLISIVLLCDSPGYRMKSYGPLPLINISNNKLIDIQINAIQQTFINFEIILCVGFDSEKICKYIRSKYSKFPIRIVENQLFNTSNSCESARLAINNTLNSKILICDGTLMFTHKTLSLINYDHPCAIYEQEPCENLEIGINIDDKNDAQHFSFGAKSTWSEIFFLNNADIVESFRKALSFQDSKNKFIFEAINELIKIKYKIKCVKNKHSVQRISNIKTYHSIKDKK